MDDHVGHSHTTLPDFAGSTRHGLRALAIGTAGLFITASLQVLILIVSGSVALLADTLHNAVDVFGTLLVGAAFLLSRRASNARFTYGYHRFEDLAGLAVVVLIAASAALVFYESFNALGNDKGFARPGLVLLAGVIGVIGNEGVAQYKIRAGKQIGSAALIADGHHSRVDGLTSLGVVAAAIGGMAGAQWLDGTLGFVIGLVIAYTAWQAGREVLFRLLDSADPNLVEKLNDVAARTPCVDHVSDLRIRHLGRTVHVVANVCVPGEISLREAHDSAEHLRISWLEVLPGSSTVDIHVDPFSDGAPVPHRALPGDAQHTH